MADRSVEPGDSAFQRAFIATSYLLGAREASSNPPFERLSAAAQALVTRLGASDRQTRAAALSHELQRIGDSLTTRGVR
jgi:hypothetical protein